MDIVREFHKQYYDSHVWEHGRTAWRGVPVHKCPLDLWVYQEIIVRTEPWFIIETGTYRGGAALFMADVADLLDTDTIIVSIDTAVFDRPAHPRIQYVKADSADPDVADELLAIYGPEISTATMVVLDSEHTKAHVLNELETWAPLVTVGCYLIVEDTNINGNPVLPGWGEGPAEAVAEFLATTDDFVVDRDCEKFLMTQNPGGYLRRVK